MAGNQFKQFQINDISDALLVLGSLISSSISNLDKFEEYTKEAMELQERCEQLDIIPNDLYESVHDKVLFRQRELLEFMADEASDIFSYLPLRKKLVKMGFLTRKLDQEVTEILNELHTIRNWTFHNVQSRLVAEKETTEKSIPPELVGIVKIEPQLNPIVVVKYKGYTKDHLHSFILHNLGRHAQFYIVLEEMKHDYQDMFDQLDEPKGVLNPDAELLVENCSSKTPVKTVEFQHVGGAARYESDVANLSMSIQKRQYDGTQESFDKHTGRAKN